MATMISTTVLTMFAATAACPRISPPMMPTLCPIGPGALRLASRTSWNTSCKKIISSASGRNTMCRDEAMVARISSLSMP